MKSAVARRVRVGGEFVDGRRRKFPTFGIATPRGHGLTSIDVLKQGLMAGVIVGSKRRGWHFYPMGSAAPIFSRRQLKVVKAMVRDI